MNQPSFRETVNRLLKQGDDGPATVHPINGTSRPATGDRRRSFALGALEDKRHRLGSMPPDSGRNSTLAWFTKDLARKFISSGELSRNEIEDAMISACVSNGLWATERRESQLTISRQFEYASKDGSDDSWHMDLSDGPGAVGAAYTLTDTDTDTPDAPAEWVQANLPRINWHELWADDSEQEWIVEPLIPVRRLVALYSAAKTGKSLLMLELAAAIAAGRKVLGQDVQARNVLYVDFENDPKDDVRTRLMAMGYEPGDLDRLSYLSFPTLAGLDSDQGGQQLMAAIKHYEAELVIVDTISRAVDGDENDNDTWRQAYRKTLLLLKRAGVAFVRLDHTGKDETRGQRGGSAKGGDVDSVWKLTAIDDMQLQLRCDFARMPVPEKDLVLIRQELPHLHHEVDRSANAGAFEAKVQAILAAFEQIKLPPDAGRPQARKALEKTGVSGRNATIQEALKRWKSINATSYWDLEK